ncbi:hypothetical protein L596_019153 [Steinernema carpocapsae]|uniref:Uncharacterized protein n=1 Tax=Steinernema carpocapsae TaxID=34508 RepID=A0A4U5N7J3_STECR|nr:hypothetical protein L596_019153 [Steinernema carpocapsae]
MRFYRAPEEPPKEVPKPPETTISNLRISAMSFSTCRLFRELLAVATDSEDEKADICRVVFFEYPQEGRTCEFIEELTIKYEDSIVSDIAFAPSAGRTHHQIAVAALEDVIIYNIDCEETHEVVECDKAVTIGTTRRKTTVNETTSYTSVEIARLPIKFSGSARIWRLNWNLIGSLLTLGYSDGASAFGNAIIRTTL